jgi:gamma-glutamylcyclotransferase, plant
MTKSDKDIYIFGFGSLIFKADFEFSHRIEGHIRGYKRVFYQGSTDHRGTVQYPGRTVTLIQSSSAITPGVAYRLSGSPSTQRRTLEYLEHREKQYDLREKVDVYSHDGQVLVKDALVYIATDNTETNPNWLGPPPSNDQAGLEVIALQIATAHGPSGPNYEYLFRLADAMRSMGVDEKDDEELFMLESLVKKNLNMDSSNGLDLGHQIS